MGNILDSNKIEFFESTFLYFQRTFDALNIVTDIVLEVSKNVNFEVLFAYSLDDSNYSEYVKQSDCIITDNLIPIYVSIQCKRIINTDSKTPTTIYQTENIDPTIANLIIDSIKYLGEEITDVKFKTIYDIVNEYPKWNFYDNQNVQVDRWLKQCNAISESFGLVCVYFKTEPTEEGTVHTIANHSMRNVVKIKKIHFLIPDNEIPEDRNNYTDWDFALQDDFIIHIINQKFVQAFGNVIPSEKDYLYFPMINKLFRINTAPQPKKGFMGVSAWWEVFLAKYEDDDTVTIDADLKNSMTGIPEFDEGMELIEYQELSDVLNEIDLFKSDTVFSVEKIQKDTVEEKKKVTQNYTNKLEDSNFYVSLKETEAQREFYNKRLTIVSINPDDSSFPINMYNCSDVQKRVIGMQYSLLDYTTKNKFSTVVDTGYQISFNFVLMNNFVGEIFDILSNFVSIITIKNNRNTLELIDNSNQQSFLINYKFIQKELYQIIIDYNLSLRQYSIKIFSLINMEKNLEYQNIYIHDNNQQNLNNLITNLDLFGGTYLVNDISISINNKNILKDVCNPLLQMNKLG